MVSGVLFIFHDSSAGAVKVAISSRHTDMDESVTAQKGRYVY